MPLKSMNGVKTEDSSLLCSPPQGSTGIASLHGYRSGRPAVSVAAALSLANSIFSCKSTAPVHQTAHASVMSNPAVVQ